MSDSNGEIAACATAGCGYRCCDFSAGNYIALYPGELNAAVRGGAGLDHLEVRPSDDGGHRAICHAGDTATCDGGYKPLDCRTYPFFPTADDPTGRISLGLAADKCPLALARLRSHAAWAAAQWRELAERSRAVRRWIAAVRLIGYRRVEPPPYRPTTTAKRPPA